MTLADERPIVIFNTTKLWSDALIVTDMAIKSLVLQRMIFCEVDNKMKRFAGLVRRTRSTYTSRNAELEKILLWLWDVAVEPVLKVLQFRCQPAGVGMFPRVWWICIGRLAQAPFHVAGDNFRLSSTRNTVTRVMSSYIPTIKALLYPRQKKLELCGPDSRVLLVAMPTTPDTPATFRTLPTTAPRFTPSTLIIPAIFPVTPTMECNPHKPGD